MPNYNLSEIFSRIEGEYIILGVKNDIYVDKLGSPLEADEKTLIFISPTRDDKQRLFDQTKARVIISDHSINPGISLDKKCLIVVKDPKYIFAKIGNELFLEKPKYDIHPTAIIHDKAKIAKNVHIGPNVYIGKCEIEENTIIYGNSFLYDNVVVGKNVVINAGCVLGASGCGQIRNDDGEYIPFPHIGRVIIEDNVEIGTNTCIAKGALCNTIVKKGSVIDSFVQIGHNVIIEENVLILANSVIGGSSHIKKNVVLAIGAHVCDYVVIEENAHIGPGVIVMNNVSANSKVVPRASITMPTKVT